MRKLKIKIKDTSTSAKIPKELKNLDYSSIPGIADFIKELKSMHNEVVNLLSIINE